MKLIKICFFLLLLQAILSNNASAQKQFKALVVTTTRGWHHEAQHAGFLAIQQLGVKNHFDVVIFEDPAGFTDRYVQQFAVIIFLHTTGDIFDTAQQKVMERYIQSGKGYAGIHSASDTEYDWEWYTKLVGRMFVIHPPIQTAKMKVLDSNFPGLQGFANGRLWTDEQYEFGPEKVSGLNYILGVDETSYNPNVDWGRVKGSGMGALHPLAWYHNYDGGRSFYTALGHIPASFNDAAFLDHIYAGILWAATGKK
ncbi:MAG: ThuA domain-containing protein [Bacteroidota bacterium]|jgi:type 1 glutamine amidotransferase|nr:ThuA domain-containing protein [Bacteroidota bacterium]